MLIGKIIIVRLELISVRYFFILFPFYLLLIYFYRESSFSLDLRSCCEDYILNAIVAYRIDTLIKRLEATVRDFYNRLYSNNSRYLYIDIKNL